MGGTYGTSLAAKLIGEGKYDEAVADATREAARDRNDPEPILDRATALGLQERWEDALSDYARAIELDRKAEVLDLYAVDDAYFSALLALARREASSATEDGVARLHTYARLFPHGAHLKDVEHWTRILRGDVQREFVKEREA